MSEDKQSSTNANDSLIEYQTHLKELVNKSQEAFEKQLSYLSAGALTISIAFIKDVVGDLSKTNYHPYLLWAWALMGSTLLINLLSHVFTSNCHNKTIGEISGGKYSYKNALKRYVWIQRLNYLSIATLIIGITFLLIFIGLNI